MVVLVGIDEAGFGPILGPLVVSSSVFLVSDHLLKADLWQVLRKSVANKRKRLAGRLLIADSKKVYSKSLGIKHLERTVLSILKSLGTEPATLGELLNLLCPECMNRLSGYPWHRDLEDRKILINDPDKTIASLALADDMAANGIKLLELRSSCLDVAHYNRMMSCVRNKASVLFTAASQLIKNAFDSWVNAEYEIIVDKLGGRIRYRDNLLRSFPDMELRILCESLQRSSYELQAHGKCMRLHFMVDADERFLPVSLASMISKYLRELLIENINRFFIGFNSNLRPTAGYWKDGLRFVQDLKLNIPDLQVDTNQLIRCR
jgi:ribonuclease HII